MHAKQTELQENTSLAQYVFQHYHRFLTDHERAVYRHLTTLFKFRDHGPPPPMTAADTGCITGVKRRWLSDDPRVIDDAQAGWEGARTHIAERIIRDHPDEVYLNYCPACGSLTRTPTARLCLSCGHSWFHVPRDVRL